MLPTQVSYWTYKEQGRHNLVTEEETRRHNEVMEAQGWDTNAISWSNSYINSQNAESNKRQADAALRNAQTNAYNAATNRFSAETGRLQLAINQQSVDNDTERVSQGWQELNIKRQQANASTMQAMAAAKQADIAEVNARTRQDEVASAIALRKAQVQSEWYRQNLMTAQTAYQNANANLLQKQAQWYAINQLSNLGSSATQSFSNLASGMQNLSRATSGWTGLQTTQ